MTTIFL